MRKRRLAQIRNSAAIVFFAVIVAFQAATVGVLAGCGSYSQTGVAGEKEAAGTKEAAETSGASGTAGAAGEVGTAGREAGEGKSGEILIAAAASLEDVFQRGLIPLFNETYPEVVVRGAYDGSGKLRTQIENGLDAQIFFPADARQMDMLAMSGIIDRATIKGLLENEVVLIAGKGVASRAKGFENILDAAGIAVGDPAGVAAGMYAEEILTALGSWDEVSSRASFGTNVREVLNWVAMGSAEVGIVFATDAASMAESVDVIAVADRGMLEAPVVYPVGMMASLGGKAEAACAFYDFLGSPEALGVFERHGFVRYDGGGVCGDIGVGRTAKGGGA